MKKRKKYTHLNKVISLDEFKLKKKEKKKKKKKKKKTWIFNLFSVLSQVGSDVNTFSWKLDVHAKSNSIVNCGHLKKNFYCSLT